jgi:hypothetical protein
MRLDGFDTPVQAAQVARGRVADHERDAVRMAPAPSDD